MTTSSFHAVAHDWADAEVAAPTSGAQPATRGGGPRPRGLGRVQLYSALGDVVGVVAAGVLVVSALPWTAPSAPGEHHYEFFLLACPVIAAVLVARCARAGARRRLAPRVADDLGPMLGALATAAVVLLALSGVGGLGASLPPAEVGIMLGVTALVVPSARRAALLLASVNPDNAVRVVVVGSGLLCDELCTHLRRAPLVTLVGVVDDDPGPGHALLGRIEDIPELCATGGVDRLVVAFAGRHPGHLAEVLQDVRDTVDVDVVVRYFELANWESRLVDVTGLSLVSIGRKAGRAEAAAKRVLDVVVAAVALSALSPLLGLVALAVRLESQGPVLFRQTRVGRHRRPFAIVKFRTMRAATRPAGLARRSPLETADLSRITALGRLLRRTGIDELPQLVNVLRGEMSLVGPRPFVPEECVDLHGGAERRFDVRPGMTGMWQVCGQHTVSFDELVRLDVQYATSWSLRGDLRILARTPGRLLRGSTE